MDNGSASKPLFPPLRKLVDSACGLLHTRAELFSVELHEEKSRLIDVFLAVALLMFFGIIFLALLTGTLIFLFPPGYRIWVAGGFSLIYFLAVGWAFWRLKSKLDAPVPFAQTINELKRDRATLCSNE